MTNHYAYTSYLLRIRRSAEGETPAWCAYLQDLTTGQRLGFATLEGLFAFLEAVSVAAQGNEHSNRETEWPINGDNQCSE